MFIMEISRILSPSKTTSTSVNGSQHRDNMQEISTIMNDVPAMTDEAQDTALVERSTADDKKKTSLAN